MRIYDLHADIGTDILDKHRLGRTDILKTDHLSKLKSGEVRGVATACFFSGKENWKTMQKMVLTTGREISDNQAAVHWVKDPDDLIIDEKLLAIISVEGMCGIKTDVEKKIDWLYDHGVRIGSLCWNESNKLAEGWPNDPLKGLTKLGERVVKRMNKRGMIIDVSHTNEKTFWDIISLSRMPIIATHSNARSLCNHQRNLTDQQIKAIAQKGGLMGLNAAKGFIDLVPAEQTCLNLAKHGKYMADLVGYEHVAIGFDFMDFFEDRYESSMANDMPDASQSQNLIIALHQVGFSQQQVEAIAYKNVENFLKNYL
ncbi:MAG: membrane dipeptidase [Erysipelotrichaceae bacterium]|nr:membrane dipeptidase [Erysipelotrichaceae bacterium]